MSAPFAGPPGLDAPGLDTPGLDTPGPESGPIHQVLATLDRPRKHYQWYYATRQANEDMLHCRQGMHAFLRAYYHYKSADWPGNRPAPLKAWTAAELARMPTYCIMDLDRDMAQTVAAEMPSPEMVESRAWLPERKLCVYSDEYKRTGFQGGLQWYRCRTHAVGHRELQVYHSRTIDIPSMFIAGACDWGIHQTLGAIEQMQHRACTDTRGCHLPDRAGHWVQQEQPEQVADLVLAFVGSQETGARG